MKFCIGKTELLSMKELPKWDFNKNRCKLTLILVIIFTEPNQSINQSNHNKSTMVLTILRAITFVFPTNFGD